LYSAFVILWNSHEAEIEMKDQKAHQKAANTLLKQIFTRKVKPGEKLLPLRNLSKKLAVDQTSLRIALKQLEFMGVLEIRRSDGVYVKDYLNYAGLELLTTLFLGQDPDESIVDEYLLYEVYKFWVVILTETLLLASKKFSPGTIKAMIEITDCELISLKDIDKMVEYELQLHKILTDNADNIAFTLLFNAIAPLRRKLTELFLKNMGKSELLNYLLARKTLLNELMTSSPDDMEKIIREYSKRFWKVRHGVWKNGTTNEATLYAKKE